MSAGNRVSADSYRVNTEDLRAVCDPSDFTFKSTAELEPLDSFIGQDRAEKAFGRAFAMDHHGHNVFAVEPESSGRGSVVLWFVRKMAEEHLSGTTLYDWCYIYNFDDKDRPRVLRIERGRGKELKRFVEYDLLDDLKARIPAVIDLKDMMPEQKEKIERIDRSIGEEIPKIEQAVVREIEEEPPLHSFVFRVIIYPDGTAGVYACHPEPDENGKPRALSVEDMQSIPTDVIDDIGRKGNELFRKMVEANRKTMELATRSMRERVAILKERIGEVFDEISTEVCRAYGEASEYFAGLRELVQDNRGIFLPKKSNGHSSTNGMQYEQAHEEDPFLPFMINVFVDNSATENVPIVVEDRPTHFNLFGKMERSRSRAFMEFSDPGHMDLKAGSVSRANGGVLIMNVKDLFMYGGWEGLRRVLLREELNIEDLAEQWIIPLRGLKPEPIPTKIKVVLLGDNVAHRILSASDEFSQLFGVKAQFDTEVARTPEILNQFARLIHIWCKREGIRHLDPSAVSELMEYASRVRGDKEKLTLNMRKLKGVCLEANAIVSEKGSEFVSAEDIRQAILDKVYRVDLVREKMYSFIQDGTLLLALNGSEVGQANALAVYQMEDGFSFGVPNRITARTFAGRGGVISVDRDVELAGPTHNKGVLTVAGYLGGKYAQDRPLSLSATISFEQNYGGIDGDSASSTELYAILSGLSGVPLRQDIAVTGSVNQHGEIQPIGGVNEKIEGFFDVCSLLSLTGVQGVMIPHQNVQNLMLRNDVVEAVKEGQFHIYAVRTIDEGMEILTAHKMGERAAKGPHKGEYPVSSINWRVENKLHKFANAAVDSGAKQ